MTSPDNMTSFPRPPEGTWAKPIRQLEVGVLPKDALNLNVQNMQLSGPMRGFGQMWLKSYRILLEGATPAPSEVIAKWKIHFGEFWPEGNRFFSSAATITPGDVAVLNLAGPRGAMMPGSMPLVSTGVLVIYTDDESFSFMTSQGHIFAGMITFNASRQENKTVVQIQALVRANDPLYELLMCLGMSRYEDECWLTTLRNVAAHFGATGEPTHHTQLIDPSVRWSEAKNIWHNAAIRTMLYMLTKPLQWLWGEIARFTKTCARM